MDGIHELLVVLLFSLPRFPPLCKTVAAPGALEVPPLGAAGLSVEV